jgi:hypothetical protein
MEVEGHSGLVPRRHHLHRRILQECNPSAQNNVRPLIVVSTAFLFRDAVVPPAYLFGRFFFPSIIRDRAEIEVIPMGSGLSFSAAV